MEEKDLEPSKTRDASRLGAVKNHPVMYRDNGETAWWVVLDTPPVGLMKDGDVVEWVSP